jgi:hypothetical protein
MLPRVQQTLCSLYAYPACAPIHWQDVVLLFEALGGEVEALSSESVRVHLVIGGFQFWMQAGVAENGGALSLHEVLQLRRFLRLAGVTPALPADQLFDCADAAADAAAAAAAATNDGAWPDAAIDADALHGAGFEGAVLKSAADQELRR